MITLQDVRRVLTEHRPTRIPAEGAMRQAAVATIVRERPAGDLELLFIRRAEHPRDPWSGHMAFPGGRVDPDDASPFEAALRETREELALDLQLAARPIGELSHVMAMAHGKPLPMVILPYVFELVREPVLSLNDEVEEVVWVPLTFLMERANRGVHDYAFAGATMHLPCYRYEGRTIWGLTLRMLDELLGLLDGLRR